MSKEKEPEMKASVGSRIVERLQGFTEALESTDAISEQFTCRKIVLNLSPTCYSPGLVRETRKLLNASQAIFAQFLGVSPQTVRAWEQGINAPQEVACRIMDEIRHDPEYWRNRIRELAVEKVS